MKKIHIVCEDYDDCLYKHKNIICADDNDYRKSGTIYIVRVAIKDSLCSTKDCLPQISTKINCREFQNILFFLY